MAADDIRVVLQQALSCLLDSKPQDPIDFLARFFQQDCEKTAVVQVAQALEGLTLQHPALEERLHTAYHRLAHWESDSQDSAGVLRGDLYTELLTLLTSDQTDQTGTELLQTLGAAAPEIVSFTLFRIGVTACLLLKDFQRELNSLLDDLDHEGKGFVSKASADCILAQLAQPSQTGKPKAEDGSRMSVQLGQELSVKACDRGPHCNRDELRDQAMKLFLGQVAPAK